MKLMKELLEAKEPAGKCVAVYISSHAVYDGVEEIFKLFGYKDVGNLVDFDLTEEELEDYTGDLRDLDETLGVWAMSEPKKSDIMKSLDSIGVIILGG